MGGGVSAQAGDNLRSLSPNNRGRQVHSLPDDSLRQEWQTPGLNDPQPVSYSMLNQQQANAGRRSPIGSYAPAQPQQTGGYSRPTYPGAYAAGVQSASGGGASRVLGYSRS